MKKSLRVISVVLSVLMIMSAFSVMTALAAGTDKASTGGDSGSTGDCVWSWSGSDKTLIISGNGSMEDYKGTDSAPWSIYSDEIYNIIIDDGVDYIGNNAFKKLSEVIYVYIPSSVKTIGEWAFYECTSLRNVVLSDGTETINDYAF